MHYKRHTEGRSCNHCCSRKAINVTYSECAFVVLGTQQAIRVRHIVICGLPGTTVFFSTFPHKWYNYRKNIINHKVSVFTFSVNFV